MRLRPILVAAALAVAAFVSPACSHDAAAEESSDLAKPASSDFRGPKLSDFRLVERSGRVVTLADLAGAPIVLDFVFTTCSGPCPRMSGRMRELQEALAGKRVKLVSVSVDPETDTPAVLSKYAAAFGADPERWWFLTGEEAQVDALVASVALARAKDKGAPLGMQVSHSTRLLVVDGRGLVRGYYDGESDAGVAAARARAEWLAEHPER